MKYTITIEVETGQGQHSHEDMRRWVYNIFSRQPSLPVEVKAITSGDNETTEWNPRVADPPRATGW